MTNPVMRLIGRALAPYIAKSLLPVDSRGGWFPVVRESYPGAWQQGVEVTLEDTLQYWAVMRCVGLISSDIAKMRIKLTERTTGGMWQEVTNPAFSPVLRKPNRFQNRIQFFTNWMESKLTRGNTYVLKQRDARGVVVALYVLDPTRVTPLVSDSGEVFYELYRDNIANVQVDRVIVPQSEMIHDRWNTLYHPLVGLSPIYAAGVNAITALRITRNSARLFENAARPGGILTAPGAIKDETAARLKLHFQENYTGENAGKVAVLGDGLTFTQLSMSAVDAQVIEQLKWNDNTIAGAFGAPAFMINAGGAPSYNNVEALNQQYYSQCLQIHIESIEMCLDEGLGLGENRGTEFELDDLLRMDTPTKMKTVVEGLKGVYTPNEGRAKFNLAPKPGGDAVYLQQQNYSIEALNLRDTSENPFGAPAPAPAPAPDAAVDDPDAAVDDPAAPDAAGDAARGAVIGWMLAFEKAAETNATV